MKMLHTHRTIAQMAFLGFERMRARQKRQREPGELRPRDTHVAYPHHSARQRNRMLRHIAAGRMPAEQLGIMVDGRVLPCVERS